MDKKTMMENIVRDANERGLFTGTWLYAQNGQIVSKGAAGFRDPEDRLPIREDSVFDLASVSKQFTAAAVMLLRRRGLLSLEDGITKFFPEIPFRGVTLRNLLTHTGGLPDHDDEDGWTVRLAKKEQRIPDNDAVVRFLCESGEKALFAPGEKYEYSNTGYCLLAEIVEKASGIPFGEFLQENLFKPAGLTSTRLCHRRKDHLTIENLACGLVLENGRYVLPDDTKDHNYVIALDGLNGDGLVHTNVLDLFTWDRKLREGEILTPEEQQMMYTPCTLQNGEVYAEDDGSGYGFGWEISRDPALGLIVAHSGGWPGYVTWYERFIDADRMLAVLCCRESVDYRGIVGFFKAMRDIAKDKDPEPIRTIEDITIRNPDRSGWAAFCGKYEHPEDADFIVDEVSMKDGDLYAKALDEDGDELEFRLYPIGENEFGRKGGMLDLKFGDNCLMFDDYTCKTLY